MAIKESTEDFAGVSVCLGGRVKGLCLRVLGQHFHPLPIIILHPSAGPYLAVSNGARTGDNGGPKDASCQQP